jgi:hypothetical protein
MSTLHQWLILYLSRATCVLKQRPAYPSINKQGMNKPLSVKEQRLVLLGCCQCIFYLSDALTQLCDRMWVDQPRTRATDHGWLLP